jgi:hypothetical protein
VRSFNVFLLLILLQGFHELEHVIQVVQRSFLGIPNGSGMLGSLVDIEPLHFAYNSLYLGLLVATFVLLGLHREGARRHGRLVFGLLAFALVFQSWHEVEHLLKLGQYVALGGTNGTGGVFGQGPGALFPLFPIPLLHLAYNTVAYVPALAAFVVIARRSRPERHPLMTPAART